MSGLTPHLLDRIRQTGPLTIADYMAECLTHPAHGYYTTRDPLGAAGDFTTAPEISQMFGEMIGVCLAQTWLDHGRPARFALAELGPGRGTLMADILRATKGVPGFLDAARGASGRGLPAAPGAAGGGARRVRPCWHDRIGDLPDLPLFLVANEFLDTMPIRQFLRWAKAGRERMVGLEGDALIFGLSPPAPLALLAHRLADTEDGDLVEVSRRGRGRGGRRWAPGSRGTGARRSSWTTAAGGRRGTRSRRCGRMRGSTRSMRRGRRT